MLLIECPDRVSHETAADSIESPAISDAQREVFVVTASHLYVAAVLPYAALGDLIVIPGHSSATRTLSAAFPGMNTLNSGFTRLPDREFDNKVSQIHMALTGNAKFPNPSPTLATLKAKLDTYQNALAMPDGKARTQAVKSARAELQKTVEQLARNLEMTPGTTETDLATTGFDLRKPAVHSDEAPAAPSNLRAKSTGVRGQVQFSFEPSQRAKTYELETALDPNTGEWVQRGMFSSSRGVVVNDLDRGKDVWGRVRAIGPKNTTSAWSDPATVMVS